MAKARRLKTQEPRAIAHEGLVRAAAGETSSAKGLLKIAAANASLDRFSRAEVARTLESRP